MTANEIFLRIKSNWKRKAVLSVVLTNVFTAIYLFLQRFPLFPAVEAPAVGLDELIPFMPDAIYLYETLLLILPVGPWLMKSKDDLARYVASFVLIAIGGFLVFVFFPTSNPRPEDLRNVNMTFAVLIQIDLGLNSFPS